MNMNQKGFANIILVVVIVVLVGAVGYFVFVKKSEPVSEQPLNNSQNTQLPSSPTSNNTSKSQIPTPATPVEPKGGGPTDRSPLPEGTAATIDKKSLVSSSGNVTISGKANGVSVLGIVVNDINGYRVFTNLDPVQVVNGQWSVNISNNNILATAPPRPFPDGVYQIVVFGPRDFSLAHDVLVVGTIVSDPSKPVTLMFVLQPSQVAIGQTSTLYWRAPNATSCEASGDWTGSKFILGDETTSKINSNKSYTLACQGAGGSVSKTVQITPY